MNRLLAICLCLLPAAAAAPAATNERFSRLGDTTDSVIQFVEHQAVEWLARYLGAEAPLLVNRDYLGFTPLMAAVRAGKPDMVRWLLSQGARPEPVDGPGLWTALHMACDRGDLESARALLDKGAPVNAVTKLGLNALTFAASSGKTALVELLLARGANPHQVTTHGYNALGYACMQTNAAAALLLLDRGADWRVRSTVGHRPLVHAAWYGHTDLVKRLLAKGADINARGPWGMTPLAAACQGRKPETARYLIEAGADVHALTVDGIGAVHLAASRNLADVVRLLLAKGASAKPVPTYNFDSFGPGVDDERDKTLAQWNGESALSDAVSRTNLDLALGKALVAAGLDVNARGAEGRTALWHAARRGDEAVVRWLLSVGATGALDSDKRHGIAPFHLAAKYGHLGIVKLLFPKDAGVDAATTTRSTALMYAAAGGHVKVVEWLLARGAAVNARNNGDGTALAAAAAGGHAAVVKLLLARGADPALRDCGVLVRDVYVDYFGNRIDERMRPRTPFVHAVLGGHLEAARLLAPYAPDVNYLALQNAPLVTDCILKGRLELAHLLVELGADVNVAFESLTLNRTTPLSAAVHANAPGLIGPLARAGADLEDARAKGHKLTPLFQAVRLNRGRVVAALLAAGARCDAAVTYEWNPLTPFQLAVHNGHYRILEQFLRLPEGKAQVNARFKVDRVEGVPLAVAMGSPRTVRLLLEHGADARAAAREILQGLFTPHWTETARQDLVNVCDVLGDHRWEILRAVLARGVDLKAADGLFLCRAAAWGDPRLLRLALGKGFDLEGRNENGHTPLLAAAHGARTWVYETPPRGCLENAQALLAAGADWRAETKDGRTVLTVGLPDAETVRWLGWSERGTSRVRATPEEARSQLEIHERNVRNAIASLRALFATGKVDIHLRNKAGQTALAYARAAGLTKVAEFLVAAGARY